MKIRNILASVSLFAMSVGTALADNGGGGNPVIGKSSGMPGGGGNAHANPEIDITQGLAIIAILVCVALLVRERMARAAR